MRRVQRTGIVLSLGMAALLLSGCGSMTLPSFGMGESVSPASTEHFVYKGHDFGPDRNTEYRQGVVDGCATAAGSYTKSHALFQNNTSYRAGWEHGRLHCKK